MRTQSNTEENSAFALTPPIKPCMRWRVVSVEAMLNFRLRVQFVDGAQGVIDLTDIVHAPGAGVLASLAAPAFFSQVFIEHGAVTWPGGIDLAPDTMYARIKQAARAAGIGH